MFKVELSFKFLLEKSPTSKMFYSLDPRNGTPLKSNKKRISSLWMPKIEA